MKRILLVDDDPLILDIIQTVLTNYGHSVDTASDGEAALKKMSSARWDLVVTDILMDELDGLALIRAIRSGNKTTKIIAISSGDIIGVNYLDTAASFGADYVTTKPVNYKELVDTVNRLLGIDQKEKSA